MDADLPSLWKIQAGDEAGLKELMVRHREPLFRFILRYVHNEADAAELTGETFFRVYQNADRFRPKAKVMTWMFSIAANLCRDSIRRHKKRRGDLSLNAPIEGSESLIYEDSFASGAPSPDCAAVSAETLDALRRAVHALPHKLKSPFIFCVLEDHSYDECAEILQTSRKTVENRIYRARQQLRNDLARFLQ